MIKNPSLSPAEVAQTISVPSLVVTPGAFVTVYLRGNGEQIQVQLHVDGLGNPCVVLNKGEHGGIVKDWAEVYEP